MSLPMLKIHSYSKSLEVCVLVPPAATTNSLPLIHVNIQLGSCRPTNQATSGEN